MIIIAAAAADAACVVPLNERQGKNRVKVLTTISFGFNLVMSYSVHECHDPPGEEWTGKKCKMERMKASLQTYEHD